MRTNMFELYESVLVHIHQPFMWFIIVCM